MIIDYIRDTQRIFSEIKYEMYKRLESIRCEHKVKERENITLNVLDFENLDEVRRTDYADYILGYIYMSNLFRVRLVVKSTSKKIGIRVEINTKVIDDTFNSYDYDVVKLTDEEYKYIYAEIRLKEATQVIKEELRNELNIGTRLKNLFNF